MNNNNFLELKKIILKEKELLKEIQKNPSSKKISELRKTNDFLPQILEKISLPNPSLIEKQNISKNPEPQKKFSFEKIKEPQKSLLKKPDLKKEDDEELELEQEVLKRIKKGEGKIVEQKEKQIGFYLRTSNKIFSRISLSLYEKSMFKSLKEDLVKANLFFLPVTYISVILFTTLLSLAGGFLVFLFFLFFNIGVELPFISLYQGEFLSRFLKTFWIIFVAPIVTFFSMFLYPSLEKKSIDGRINQELPFVTIHSSAIAGSMIEPSKLFEIITLTKEYPYISREFTKVINEINIYGSNLVNALRESASNTSNEGLKDLLNGLATTITSGGDLRKFFDKRAQTLLFDYKLERERYTKLSETFMDIYISVVIASPMILMLLLMMMKISGLGLSFSSSMISLIMVLGVVVINIAFLVFLYLKQPNR